MMLRSDEWGRPRKRQGGCMCVGECSEATASKKALGQEQTRCLLKASVAAEFAVRGEQRERALTREARAMSHRPR